jgi:hypothetical protein
MKTSGDMRSLGFYVAYNGSLLSTFRDNLLVQSSRVNSPRRFVEFEKVD